jgi:hypothetical protein
MACHVDTSEYQLHLYENYPADANDCWSNPNVYLVAPDASGKFSPNAPRVSNPQLNTPYFFVAKVTNRSAYNNSAIEQMQFGIPSFMLVNGEQQKTVGHAPARVAKGASGLVHSLHVIQFIHPGNYEIYAQLKSWSNRDENVGQAPPSDWPTKGPLYARDSVMVKNS